MIDEDAEPIARGMIVDRTVGNVFVTLLRTRQFHAMCTTNEPSVHHGVSYFRMELESIAGARPEGLDRKSVAFGQELMQRAPQLLNG